MHDPSLAGDKTAHLLSHTFTEATEDRVHGIIKGYIEANPKKIQELAGPWLKQKKTTVSDYVNFIIERGSKFDELALMIFSIATKCHIGVIHSNNLMWTTNESRDMEECDVLFLNRGKLMFEAVESIEVEHEDEEAKTVAEKEDPTYYPEEEEEDYEGGGDGEEEEGEGEEEEEGEGEEEEEGDGEEEEEPEEGEEEVEGGEKVSLAVAVVPPVQRQTPKKESIVVHFNTLTRSVRKRQQEEMMRDVESEMDLNRKKEEERKTQGAPVREKPITKPVESAPVTMETQSAPVKCKGDKQSGVPVKPADKEQPGAPVKPASDETSGAPEDAPTKRVKGARRSKPKGAPENVGKKSGGKGGKPKLSSKKGDDEGGKEGVGVTKVTRAMQKKLDEEEEERKKAKKTDKKDKKKKKKDRKVKKDEEEIGEEEGKEDEPVEKKQKLEEDIEDLDVKPKVQELEAKIKMGNGDFEVKTIGLKKRRPKKYRCRICKEVVDSIGERNRHMAEVHNMNEFKCGDCDQKFETENSLKRHEKIHVKGVKILECDECEKTFLHESQRKRHMMTHTEEVKYHCPLKDCAKRKGFKSLSDYRMHMDTHSGEKFPCKEKGCDYVGKNKHQLSDHTRRQHGPQKPCPNKDKGCNFESRDKRQIKKHVDTVCKYKD